MLRNKAFAGLLAGAMIVGFASQAQATDFPVGSPNFFITSGNPFSDSITATFFNTISGPSTHFDDSFLFTIPQNGVGSGSVSTSFSGDLNELIITDVIINGISFAGDLVHTAGGYSLTVSGIDILANVMNTIEIIGDTGARTKAGGYSGTATFTTTDVPEPASWAMMLGGFGLLGATMRRRRTSVTFA